MIKLASLVVAIFSFSMLSPLYAGGVEGIVTANKLNLRVKPTTQYAKVASVKKDDRLEVVSHKDGWYQVVAPPNTEVWVSALFVKDGMIAKRVHLRAGPSVAFSSYRFAEPGEKVKILDESRNKDWLKIAPPPGLTVWASAQYIFLTPENAAKLANKKAEVAKSKVKGDKKDAAPVKGPAVKKGDAQLPLPFIDSSEKVVTVEGYIVPLRQGAKYVTHAVASKMNGGFFPLCYIHSKKHNLYLWKGKRVRVTGTQRWVKGWQRPVVDVSEVTPLESE